LIAETREKVIRDAAAAGLDNDERGIDAGGSGAVAYGDAVATYLAFGVDKVSDYWSTICSWNINRYNIRNTFARQAIPMVWDYAEANPFSSSTGNFTAILKVVKIPAIHPGN
jgi:putative DNA methylase